MFKRLIITIRTSLFTVNDYDNLQPDINIDQW